MRHTIIIRTTADSFLLIIWDRIQCLPKGIRPAVFYFKEDQTVLIPANNIHFSLTTTEITFYNGYSLLMQIFACSVFIECSDFSCIHTNLSASLQTFRFALHAIISNGSSYYIMLLFVHLTSYFFHSVNKHQYFRHRIV